VLFVANDEEVIGTNSLSAQIQHWLTIETFTVLILAELGIFSALLLEI
jgi:hypothetical protein